MTETMGTAPPRQWKLPSLAGLEWLAAGGVACLGIAALKDPSTIEDGPILCPFRLMTGLPCPGCGLTRAWVYAMHGWWRDSLTANPFGVPLMILAAVLAVIVVVRRLRHRPAPSADRFLAHPLTKIALAAWLLWAVVRIALILA